MCSLTFLWIFLVIIISWCCCLSPRARLTLSSVSKAMTLNRGLLVWPWKVTTRTGSHKQSAWRAASASFRLHAASSFISPLGVETAWLDEVRPPVQLAPFMCQSEESMSRFHAVWLIWLLFFALLVMQSNIYSQSKGKLMVLLQWVTQSWTANTRQRTHCWLWIRGKKLFFVERLNLETEGQ